MKFDAEGFSPKREPHDVINPHEGGVHLLQPKRDPHAVINPQDVINLMLLLILMM